MSEIKTFNPNEGTADIAPTIEKSGGDAGFSSFEELEAVENYQERAKSQEKKEVKAQKKAEPKAEADVVKLVERLS